MIISANHIHSIDDFYRIIAEKLGFPSHFGNNLDALFDCLCERSEPTLLLIAQPDAMSAAIGEKWDALKETMCDAANENSSLDVAFGATIVCYPKCTTCQNAVKWLAEKGINADYRHIAEDNPTADELRSWHRSSGLPLRRFFNTSGIKYREQQLSAKLPQMSEDEQLSMLAADGMLVKRPILLFGKRVLVGFRENEWQDALLF